MQARLEVNRRKSYVGEAVYIQGWGCAIRWQCTKEAGDSTLGIQHEGLRVWGVFYLDGALGIHAADADDPQAARHRI